ncbi:MAG: DUF4435 domain-containing protein [Lentisphaeria bacterium]|nr:DUF4435 domain-containing protein [Lentisphaeria bacterium]
MLHYTRVVVACDSDHSPFASGSPRHPQIVRTYGYSIENTMYCPTNLNSACRKTARSDGDFQVEIMTWYDEFSHACKELLVYDIANHIYSVGHAIFGDNCCQFLQGKNSRFLDASRVARFVESVAPAFAAIDIDSVRLALNKDERPLRLLIKGHFLTNAVMHMISDFAEAYRSKRVKVSHEFLYGMIADGCGNCSNENCDDFLTLKTRLQCALEAVWA